MRKSFVWLGGASLLVLGCGDDAPATPGDESSSGSPTTTTGMMVTTTAPDGTTFTGMDDDTSSTGPETSTGVADASTGPDDACGNDAIDGDEICDGTDLAGQDCTMQGFDAGELGCAADCGGFDTSGCLHFNCGNGVAEGKEACDGPDLAGNTCQGLGYDSGTLSCTFNCSLALGGCGTCGNVIIDGGEVCDNVALLGQTCISQGFTSGQLGCAADCMQYDTSDCGLCGNDLVDGAEVCDGDQLDGATCLSLGYDSGILACQASCSVFDTSGCGTCGNGVTDGDELCDGPSLGGQTCTTQGFDSGTLACAPDCYAYVTSGCGTCGNGLVEGGESCDGANLSGQTCASLGLTGGTLACSPSCQYDFSGCDIPGTPFGSDVGYTGFVIQGAPLPCDDILATGTPTLLTDDSNLVVPIGFTFPFYGMGYANVNVQSNGALHFGSNVYMTFGNQCLPTNTAPNTNNLYVFWDDLNPGAAGPSEVYYQTLGPVGNRRFVVQWETAHFGGDTNDLIRVQAMLDEATGQINVCYPDTLSAANLGNNGAEATSGIQLNNTTGFHYSCNTPSLTNGTLLLYMPN
jgi:hypothetical protein